MVQRLGLLLKRHLKSRLVDRPRGDPSSRHVFISTFSYERDSFQYYITSSADPPPHEFAKQVAKALQPLVEDTPRSLALCVPWNQGLDTVTTGENNVQIYIKCDLHEEQISKISHSLATVLHSIAHD